jgi:hypothetical protein
MKEYVKVFVLNRNFIHNNNLNVNPVLLIVNHANPSINVHLVNLKAIKFQLVLQFVVMV